MTTDARDHSLVWGADAEEETLCSLETAQREEAGIEKEGRGHTVREKEAGLPPSLWPQ